MTKQVEGGPWVERILARERRGEGKVVVHAGWGKGVNRSQARVGPSSFFPCYPCPPCLCPCRRARRRILIVKPSERSPMSSAEPPML
jgi:hypothetical protein